MDVCNLSEAQPRMKEQLTVKLDPSVVADDPGFSDQAREEKILL